MIKIADKEDLLSTVSVAERLQKILGLMEGEIGVLQVEKRIRSRVKRQMEKTQREYYLNEQMKAIQRELGDGEEGSNELTELEERIAKTKFSKEARTKAEARAAQAQADVADVCRSHRRAQLSRLAARPALGQEEQGQARPDRSPRRSSTTITTASRRSRSASSSISRCSRAPASSRARSSASSALRASARPRSASRSPRRPAASSSACRSAACATRPRSAVTAGPTSARCPARSSSR